VKDYIAAAAKVEGLKGTPRRRGRARDDYTAAAAAAAAAKRKARRRGGGGGISDEGVPAAGKGRNPQLFQNHRLPRSRLRSVHRDLQVAVHVLLKIRIDQRDLFCPS